MQENHNETADNQFSNYQQKRKTKQTAFSIFFNIFQYFFTYQRIKTILLYRPKMQRLLQVKYIDLDRVVVSTISKLALFFLPAAGPRTKYPLKYYILSSLFLFRFIIIFCSSFSFNINFSPLVVPLGLFFVNSALTHIRQKSYDASLKPFQCLK